MEKEKLHIGDQVTCSVKEDMDAPFEGVVEKVYENSALLSITQYASADRTHAMELNHKIVVSLARMKMAKKQAHQAKEA
ncbi:hypothetical protein IV38_GL001812 [Lactobacillus selangorensis]|uniref:DUF2187 domain-containing protein n=1 Tax=Lactobacillus selangorensis TaxID=81857 RepID=A0A0R2FHA0_9LACO|nr:hypothetical protein [Lactobacillus selangorensis]KRN27971.1 hypothetical protein IV38_GL001812 [Lactobacillus selangorensis]KRN30558.1 hypothetical protein IV40_GL001744 [Lactobacillus selangorensis]